MYVQHHAFSLNIIPLEGFNVFKLISSLLAIFLLSGCSSDLVLSPPKQPEYKSMPEITQSVTPTQQRAIMAGERPDWSERTPINTIKRY
jgi:PBP1b-binding outer membrane lipoprotein LpoB